MQRVLTSDSEAVQLAAPASARCPGRAGLLRTMCTSPLADLKSPSPGVPEPEQILPVALPRHCASLACQWGGALPPTTNRGERLDPTTECDSDSTYCVTFNRILLYMTNLLGPKALNYTVARPVLKESPVHIKCECLLRYLTLR